MELNVHAGDDGSSLAFEPSDGYFPSQSLRAGILGGTAMRTLPPPLSVREAIEREIMKDQIREEILAKMAERRILEEEVRREIEIERYMEIRRFNVDRFSMLASNADLVIHSDPPSRSFMPCWPHGRSGDPLRRKFVHDAAEFAFRERSPSHLLQKKPLVYPAQSSWHHKLEKSSPLEETTASNCKLSSAKRKACGDVRLPAEKQWGCALCEVSSTSEKGLKEHLQGKRHKMNEALLNSKSTVQSPSKKIAILKSNGASASGPWNSKHQSVKGASTSGPGKQKYWCDLCSVSCNSKNMMARHCNGKKHKSLTVLKNGNRVEGKAAKGGSNEEPCRLIEAEGLTEEDSHQLIDVDAD